MNALAVLKKARALIAKGWTKGVLRERRAHGRVRYCVTGATAAASGGDCAAEAAADRLLVESLPFGFRRGVVGVQIFNDTRKSKRPVLALFDRAIKRAERDK